MMRGKHIIFAVLIGALLFSNGPYAHARLHSNSSDSAFDEGGGTANTEGAVLTCSISIRELIIKGAEYFFKAHADIDILSEKVEISDIYGADFYTIWWTVNSALDNMNMARYYYQELQYKANHTPYNQVVIDKLLVFDYDSFQEQNSLLKDVFSEIKGYLAVGDVRGIYSRTSAYFDTLINTLQTIKGELYAGKVPSNVHMWDLNQSCAKAHMFGQYVARVFSEIN
ncbi:MAG: hypothetical protein GTO45_33725 [Candidatus Aminicenantes bacterium]|nr:hypothetical protein [Candidatus Aminicenantes bacterium]NIM83669.1 hypothetical protein [Candidatus Aminicenantes bacterium]NIN23094.1 hypothetical protein [Candidatus Aminicenantes bacterium]NIN46821.1 hypothetical protein [Candidatus Aminicenantes bacterium]NIN89743.1 hypothetical protein [Candidatus Aminicenantes bacterium]